MMTGDEADERAAMRSFWAQVRLYTLGAFVLFAFVVLALLLQWQQERLEMVVDLNQANAIARCEERRSNTIRVNDTWERLADIERRNRTVDQTVKIERIAALEAARLEVPRCR